MKLLDGFDLPPPPLKRYGPMEVVALRRRLGVSQRGLADLLARAAKHARSRGARLKVATTAGSVKWWEAGRRRPGPDSQLLLLELERRARSRK